MSQVDLLNKLFPSIPELNEILTTIREKYLIPEVLPEHEQLIETLSQERTAEEWEAIRQEIEDELRAWFQPVGSGLDKTAKLFMDAIEKSDGLKAFLMGKTVGVSEPVASRFVEAVTKNAVSGNELLRQFFAKGSEQLLDHLITGRPISLPAVWLNLVVTLSIPPDDEKVVVAIAHQFSDPEEIIKDFRAKMIQAFGEKPKRITKEHSDTTEYLAMKNTGKSLDDIVDKYLERHPDEITYASGTSKYNAARKRLKDTLKHLKINGSLTRGLPGLSSI